MSSANDILDTKKFIADKLQGKLPQHIAIIMDGNGRWAKSKLLPRVEGHRAGAKTVRMVVEECRKLGVRYLTLFAFSTENWNRPKDEVSALMKLFERYLESELELLVKNDIRLRAIGNLDKLPPGVRNLLSAVQENTKDRNSMDLILAVSYGGREELLEATRRVAVAVKNGSISPDAINADLFRQHFYAPDIPDPDLLIRTSDENRISNFLLWQLAYSEIVVSPVYWPAFNKNEFYTCLEAYAKRVRRFGLTDEQVEIGSKTNCSDNTQGTL